MTFHYLIFAFESLIMLEIFDRHLFTMVPSIVRIQQYILYKSKIRHKTSLSWKNK